MNTLFERREGYRKLIGRDSIIAESDATREDEEGVGLSDVLVRIVETAFDSGYANGAVHQTLYGLNGADLRKDYRKFIETKKNFY
jgi:hypothetical protein